MLYWSISIVNLVIKYSFEGFTTVLCDLVLEMWKLWYTQYSFRDNIIFFARPCTTLYSIWKLNSDQVNGYLHWWYIFEVALHQELRCMGLLYQFSIFPRDRRA